MCLGGGGQLLENIARETHAPGAHPVPMPMHRYSKILLLMVFTYVLMAVVQILLNVYFTVLLNIFP